MDPREIFNAANNGDVAATRACLDAGADPAALSKEGYTALQLAAMAANRTDVDENLAVLRLLLEAGSPLEFSGDDGRTALYLAAEFAPAVDAVQLLLDAGARADIHDKHGNHIMVNAMMPGVRDLLSRATGRPVAEPPPPEPAPLKMSVAQWRAAKTRINAVFAALEQAGLVTHLDAGQTQSDGFYDCTEIFHGRGGEAAGLHGFCFCTRQDLNRAKRTSRLNLAFWGAPKGDAQDMKRVGQLVVEAFQQAGFMVDWNGSDSTRPTVHLQTGG